MKVLVDPVLETRRYGVMEIFGPTVQGEGPDAGRPCQFIRLGGCDYRCSWCDTMEAVDPKSVRENATWMTAEEIVQELLPHPPLVILSGGNPALYHGDHLLQALHEKSYEVSIETQGSMWRDWLSYVDQLVVSPKPPSSGMATEEHEAQTVEFMRQAIATRPWQHRACIKIVCFDEVDYEWAVAFHLRYPGLSLFLSAGTEQQLPPSGDLMTKTDWVRRVVGDRYRWLCERAAADDRIPSVRVLPQLHTIAWGAAKGV